MTIPRQPLRSFAQSVVETVRHPLVVLDSHLVVRAANSAFEGTFGIALGDAVGSSFMELREGGLAVPELLEMLLRVVTTGEAFEGFEVSRDFLGVGRRELVLNARRIYADDDPASMVLLAMEDATAERMAREAVHQLNIELENKVRERTAQLVVANQELEAFCYSVSHDLRAPLRAIDGFSRELHDAYLERLDDTARHYLKRIRANSQRMANLIDDLLHLSRLGRADMNLELVDLSSIACEVADDLRRQDPERNVQMSIQSELIVEGDERLLRIAICNLMDNAWKFTSKKSHATITVGRSDEGKGVEYFVRDDGVGFDPKYAGKLFGAFQRLHHEAEFPGTGVGLAIVQRVVHRHGGTVKAQSELGKWAMFSFTLGGGSRE
ncbi:Phytochrome-like protein cph1 [Pirellula sp. SH-Sr6A]|uniref:sensor histidine kinase n=1 Tax=Pirellula sp. SH-Sr6A TaxID=1632865 RepID=UPI00078D2064|nr:ATP-binding protein [Pirellula sp. SH-Sr6A]AMV31386.1 Phytochrome-like protein cph1 [Pirellula sp. SH-Sr6A]